MRYCAIKRAGFVALLLLLPFAALAYDRNVAAG